MKYIRTKDGIYRVLQWGAKRKHYVAVFDNQISGHKEYDTKEIIAQADTIEELCDEYVGIDQDGHYIIHSNEWIKGARIVPINEIIYYGAIWTDKGLIYVAKLNDEKGELELL